MKLTMMVAIALALTLPADGHGQARTVPTWLECFSPNECEVRVASLFRGVRARNRALAVRAASACQAAGYSHYVAGHTEDSDFYEVQSVYFTNDSAPPARLCSFSATAEFEVQARQVANVHGYSWPVDHEAEEAQEQFQSQPAWFFEPGENDWGESVPLSDEIVSPVVPAMRSDQEHLLGILWLTRACAAQLTVRQDDPESSEWWAYTAGESDHGDRILEIRVDRATVEEQGQTVTIPTVGMVASSERTFGVAVRSEEHEDNAAFEWPVSPPDRELIRQHFPHCVESP